LQEHHSLLGLLQQLGHTGGAVPRLLLARPLAPPARALPVLHRDAANCVQPYSTARYPGDSTRCTPLHSRQRLVAAQTAEVPPAASPLLAAPAPALTRHCHCWRAASGPVGGGTRVLRRLRRQRQPCCCRAPCTYWCTAWRVPIRGARRGACAPLTAGRGLEIGSALCIHRGGGLNFLCRPLPPSHASATIVAHD
jgi:hypothetical protein